MVYVALLRGINVGGNSKVEMPRLKSTFERLGFTKVVTYINSGNVIFYDDARTSAQIVVDIEKGIQEYFGFAISVVVRDIDNVKKINDAIPKLWANDSDQKTDVMFLWDEINNPDIINNIAVKSDIETIKYTNGVLLWNIARENVTKGNVIKLNKSELYKKMTIRNVNTVRKLLELMKSIQI